MHRCTEHSGDLRVNSEMNWTDMRGQRYAANNNTGLALRRSSSCRRLPIILVSFEHHQLFINCRPRNAIAVSQPAPRR